MTFAPNVGGALLFGGTGNPFPTNETWTYDGSHWTLLAPVTAPTGRIELEMVYDLARHVAVPYGGAGSTTAAASETWEFDGVDWLLRTPATNPGSRSRYGLSYDSARGRVVLYGGVTGNLGIPTNPTWEYDGNTWTQVTPAANPGPLDRPAMCFDPAIGKTVLFGGAFGSTIFDATWTYDGTNWTQVAIPGSRPAVRQAPKMVYDDARGVCVLTGGMTSNVIYDDTWEFNGVTWTQQPTTKQPARDHGLAFLPSKRQVVEFGGFTAAPNSLSNQTWEFGARWNAYGTGCPGSNGVPLDSLGMTGCLGSSPPTCWSACPPRAAWRRLPGARCPATSAIASTRRPCASIRVSTRRGSPRRTPSSRRSATRKLANCDPDTPVLDPTPAAGACQRR